MSFFLSLQYYSKSSPSWNYIPDLKWYNYKSMQYSQYLQRAQLLAIYNHSSSGFGNKVHQCPLFRSNRESGYDNNSKNATCHLATKQSNIINGTTTEKTDTFHMRMFCCIDHIQQYQRATNKSEDDITKLQPCVECACEQLIHMTERRECPSSGMLYKEQAHAIKTLATADGLEHLTGCKLDKHTAQAAVCKKGNKVESHDIIGYACGYKRLYTAVRNDHIVKKQLLHNYFPSQERYAYKMKHSEFLVLVIHI